MTSMCQKNDPSIATYDGMVTTVVKVGVVSSPRIPVVLRVSAAPRTPEWSWVTNALHLHTWYSGEGGVSAVGTCPVFDGTDHWGKKDERVGPSPIWCFRASGADNISVHWWLAAVDSARELCDVARARVMCCTKEEWEAERAKIEVGGEIGKP